MPIPDVTTPDRTECNYFLLSSNYILVLTLLSNTTTRGLYFGSGDNCRVVWIFWSGTVCPSSFSIINLLLWPVWSSRLYECTNGKLKPLYQKPLRNMKKTSLFLRDTKEYRSNVTRVIVVPNSLKLWVKQNNQFPIGKAVSLQDKLMKIFQN